MTSWLWRVPPGDSMEVVVAVSLNGLSRAEDTGAISFPCEVYRHRHRPNRLKPVWLCISLGFFLVDLGSS